MEKTNLVLIKEEVNKNLADPEILNNLLATTFKGLTVNNAKQALLEGMMTGFKFKDFLEKNIYAMPFGSKYSLVGSIDYCRKIGMRSGVVGVSAPLYKEDEKGGILTCEITVKRKAGDYIGEFTAVVYFKEYNTGRNIWASKPRTMISKVAEMHALRKACPEEMSNLYVEEEYEKEDRLLVDIEEKKKEEVKEWGIKIMNCKDIEELKSVWASIPGNLKTDELTKFKEELKIKLTPEGEITE